VKDVTITCKSATDSSVEVINFVLHFFNHLAIPQMFKSIFSTSIFALLFTGTVAAQHINIGIKGGLNAFWLSNDNNVKTDTKLGFHAGLIGHIHASSQFAFQPELYYSVQGAQYTVAGSDLKLNLNYVNVPLLLQYMFDNGFRLQAGPQAGFLVSAKSNNTDVKNAYESFDLGIVGGISYVNPATDFGVDLRYNHGLSNINKNNPVNSYNRGLQLGVFYLFNHN